MKRDIGALEELRDFIFSANSETSEKDDKFLQKKLEEAKIDKIPKGRPKKIKEEKITNTNSPKERVKKQENKPILNIEINPIAEKIDFSKCGATELRIIELRALGYSNKQIAEKLNIKTTSITQYMSFFRKSQKKEIRKEMQVNLINVAYLIWRFKSIDKK